MKAALIDGVTVEMEFASKGLLEAFQAFVTEHQIKPVAINHFNEMWGHLSVTYPARHRAMLQEFFDTMEIPTC